MEKRTGTGPVLLCRGRACHSGSEDEPSLYDAGTELPRRPLYFMRRETVLSEGDCFSLCR
jgi:hypothetical protein